MSHFIGLLFQSELLLCADYYYRTLAHYFQCSQKVNNRHVFVHPQLYLWHTPPGIIGAHIIN